MREVLSGSRMRESRLSGSMSQRTGAERDMFDLAKPRHISTPHGHDCRITAGPGKVARISETRRSFSRPYLPEMCDAGLCTRVQSSWSHQLTSCRNMSKLHL